MAIMERLEWQRKASKAGVAKVPRSRFCQHALKGQKLLAQGLALGTMAARLSP